MIKETAQQLYNQKLEKSIKEENNKQDKKEQEKKDFERLKKAFFRIDTDETISKWKILSRAYELGKKIYPVYSVKKLSEDFDIPYTTTKRVLSLDKATPRTWDLINSGKITAFKVAQICMSKSNKLQDKTVEMVIKQNLSTCDIKKLRIDGRGDIKQARLDNAIKKGFARKEVAYKSFRDTLIRLNKLLNLKKEDLPEGILTPLMKLMKYSKEKLDKKIIEFEDDK